MKKIYGFILSCTLLASMLISCDFDDYITFEGEELVVDGWINNDEAPVVILTKNIPVALHNFHAEDISELFVTDASVRVVCDGDTVALESQYDETIFPPIVYTTTEMKGCVGKQYTLLVDVPDGRHLSAETTIPAPVALDSLTVKKPSLPGSNYDVYGHFKDNPLEKNYYKYFVKLENPDEEFTEFGHGLFLTPPFTGVFDDVLLGAHTAFPVKPGKVAFNSESRSVFVKGDVVTVRFVQMDAASFQFWYELQDVLAFSSAMSMSFSKDVTSNIKGGLGAWCGYGATYYTIEIK